MEQQGKMTSSEWNIILCNQARYAVCEFQLDMTPSSSGIESSTPRSKSASASVTPVVEDICKNMSQFGDGNSFVYTFVATWITLYAARVLQKKRDDIVYS